jgi:hypothetical protein
VFFSHRIAVLPMYCQAVPVHPRNSEPPLYSSTVEPERVTVTVTVFVVRFQIITRLPTSFAPVWMLTLRGDVAPQLKMDKGAVNGEVTV